MYDDTLARLQMQQITHVVTCFGSSSGAGRGRKSYQELVQYVLKGKGQRIEHFKWPTSNPFLGRTQAMRTTVPLVLQLAKLSPSHI